MRCISFNTLDAAIYQSREECVSQIPISLYDQEGRKINSTRYADANTRILSPVGTQVDCSSTLPVSYKWDDGTYLCKGRKFFPCKDISLFEPSIASQADHLSKEFTTPLGIGIMADSRITQSPIEPSKVCLKHTTRPVKFIEIWRRADWSLLTLNKPWGEESRRGLFGGFPLPDKQSLN